MHEIDGLIVDVAPQESVIGVRSEIIVIRVVTELPTQFEAIL